MLEKVKTSIFTSIIFISIFSCILMVLGIIFADWILYVMNTPENIFYDSRFTLWE